MQSMFRLRWSSEAPGDKIMEKSALHKPIPMPVVDIPNFMSKMKRKRSDSPEPALPHHAHVLKKWKAAQGEVKPAAPPAVMEGVARAQITPGAALESQTAQPTASAEVLQARPIAQPSKNDLKRDSPVNVMAPTTETDLTVVQQAIEAQINYEILLKHNEMRLIEQELAKCQISLEQLRRCTLIPYPGSDGLSQDVSSGVGPALQPPSGYTVPQHPPAWGVADGPYTRHYAKWLIPDPKFDPMPERAAAPQ